MQLPGCKFSVNRGQTTVSGIRFNAADSDVHGDEETVVCPLSCSYRALLDEARPTVLLRHRALLVVRRLGALVGHLEEQQIGQLLDVVAIRHAVVTQDVAVIPEFLDDARCVHQ
jgi:hypothetical protein